MAFDAKEYRNRVLSQYSRSKEPILRKALGELKQNPQLAVPSQLDLVDFYDVPANADAVALATLIDSVASAIKAAALKPGGSRQPFEFHELIVARNPGLRTPAFWAGMLQRRAAQGAAALAEFGTNAAADFKNLGVVTSRQLREVAKGSGVPESVSDTELAEVVQAEGVTVVADLPVVSAPAQVLREILTGLKKTSARSVLSAIFLEQGEPDSFSILDGFRASSGSHTLTVATLTRGYLYAQGLPANGENDALAKILSAIKNAVSSDSELTDIVTAYFIDLGRQTFKEIGTKRGALRAFVDRTGIDEHDAARILVQVAPVGSGQQRNWSDVQSLVASGALKEGRRLYENLFSELAGSTSTEQTKALQSLSGTEAKLEELRSRAQTAQTQGDLETASKALNEALTLCSDDETLVAAARAMPPAAPTRFVSSVSEDARKVKLSWEPGFGSTEDVVYQIIRKTGSAPQNNNDGMSLGEAIEATAFDDVTPPVAVRVFYGVSASRGGGSSPVSVAEVIALPPVTNVVVSSDPSSVSLRWTTPPEARTIEITQTAPDGASIQLQPGTQGGTTAQGLRTGSTYTYLITTVYTGNAGETLKSSTLRVTGIPRGVAEAVSELAISGKGAIGARAEVAAEWKPVEGYLVEIWHYVHKPVWLPGSRLGMPEIRGQGTQLAGKAITAGVRQGVQGTTGQGLLHYVAITRDGEFGIVGAVRPFGSAPPVQNIRAERFGEEVVLSWDWPGPEFEVRVRWNGGERIIAMNEYQTQGGCRVAVGTVGSTVTVTSVAGEGDSRWISTEASIKVEGSEIAIAYDVEYQRKIFGPPSGATLNFAFGESPVPVDVVVVGHFSKFMPFDSTQGSELMRATVSAASPQLDVTLPRAGKGPVWVRAFATTPGARLIDPSPTRMKVD